MKIKRIFKKILIIFLWGLCISINPIDHAIIVTLNSQNFLQVNNSKNQSLLTANIIDNQFSVSSAINPSISYSKSVACDNQQIEQLNLNYDENTFSLYLDKKGNLVVNGMEFYSYQLKIIALSRNIFLYNNLFAKLGLMLETDSVFNYSNLKIYEGLYIKTHKDFGNFENLQNIFVFTGDLKIDICNAFINNGTILCNDNFVLNKNNKFGQIKLGRLEVYKNAFFENIENSSCEITDNTCKFKGYVSGLSNSIFVNTSNPTSTQRKTHFHDSNACFNYHDQQYQFKNPNYLPSLLEINTKDKPKISSCASLVIGNFDNDLSMPKVVSPLLIDKHAQLQNIVYTGDGIEISGIKETQLPTSLYSAVVGHEKLSINNVNSSNPSLRNGSSLGSTKGVISINLQNKNFSIVTDQSMQFPKHDSNKLILLRPTISNPRFNFLKVECLDPNYLFKHPFDQIIFEPASFGFIEKFEGIETKNFLKENLRFYVSPEICKELTALNIFKFTGKAFIGEYNDFSQQFEELVKIGNLYSLIHGTPIKLSNKNIQTKIHGNLEPEMRKTLKQIIRKFNGNINARELFKRINQKIEGTHIYALSNEKINKASFSFVLAYLIKEKNEICISLALHLVENQANKATIFGNDINIQSKKMIGNQANLKAKNNITISCQDNITFNDSNFESENMIKLESNGQVILYGPKIKTKNLFLYGKLGNNIFPIYLNIENKVKKNIWSFLGFNSQETFIKQKIAQLAKIAVDKFALKTDKDNNLCAVEFEKLLDLLILDASENNNITSVQEKLIVENESIKIGLDFCGISFLIDGEFKKCLFDLATTDPLIRETLKFKDTNNLSDAFAQTIYATIETFRALVHISQNNKDLKTLLNRFGILDLNGNFNPKITIGLTTNKSFYEKTSFKSPTINANTVIVNGRNLNIETNFNTNNFVNNSNITNIKGNQESEKKYFETNGINLGINKTLNISANVFQSSGTELNINNKINSNNISQAILNGKEINFTGTINNIDNLSGNIEKLTIKSIQNKTEKGNVTHAIDGGINSASLSYVDNSEKNDVVNKQTSLNVKNTKNLRLKALTIIGALLNSSQETTLNAHTIHYQNICDSKEKKDIAFNANVNVNDVIPIIADIGYSNKSEKSINNATVSKNINIETCSDISTLNRDLSKCKEIISSDGQYYRVIVPVVNTQKVSQAFDDIKKLFSGELELNAENITKVTDQLDKELGQISEQEQILEQHIQKENDETDLTKASRNQNQQNQETNIHFEEIANQETKNKKINEIKFQSHELVTQEDKIIKVNIISKNAPEHNNFNEKLKLIDYIFDQKSNTIRLIYQEQNNSNKIIEIKGDAQSFCNFADLRHKLFKNYILSHESKQCKNSKEEFKYFNDETAEKIKYTCNSAASFLLDFTFLGPAKLSFQAATGFDPITNEKLSPSVRTINGIFDALPIFKHTKTCAKTIFQSGKNLFNKSIYKINPKIIPADNIGIKITEKLSQKTTEQIVKSEPEIGRKLEYFFGKATGNQHNIERSIGNQQMLRKIGINDNPTNRKYIEECLKKAFVDPTNISKFQENGRVVKEFLLGGPTGFLKVESIWDKNRLITIFLKV